MDLCDGLFTDSAKFLLGAALATCFGLLAELFLGCSWIACADRMAHREKDWSELTGDKEDGEEHEPTVCLFCADTGASALACFVHMKDKHGFDIHHQKRINGKGSLLSPFSFPLWNTPFFHPLSRSLNCAPSLGWCVNRLGLL